MNCILLQCLILFCVVKQGYGDNRCDSFVTKKSTTMTGKLLNISLDPVKWGSFSNDIYSCTVEIGLTDLFIVRFLQVNMTNSQPTTTQPNPACFFISKYEFLVYEDMKPVQTLLCSDVGKLWYIPWPFDSAFLRIHFTTYYPRPRENLGDLLMEVTSYSSKDFSSERHSISPGITDIVNFPHEEFNDTCLKYQREYKIIYTWLTRRQYFKRQYRFRMVNATSNTAFCIDVKCHKDCTNRPFFVQCGMEVDVLIDGEKIMKYECLSTHGYWCLPLKWTTGHEFIDVVITSSSSSRKDNSTYEVFVTTNSTRPFGDDCIYQQTTTTTTTPRTTTTAAVTRSPWTLWTPVIIPEVTTTKTRVQAKTYDMVNTGVPVIGILLFVVIVCAIVYYQKRKWNNSQSSSATIPNEQQGIYSIRGDTSGFQDGNHTIPANTRGYQHQTFPTAPNLRMINPSQSHAVSSRRAQNYQVPSRNLAAHVLQRNDPNQSRSIQGCSSQNSRVHNAARRHTGTSSVHNPSSNGQNRGNPTSEINLRTERFNLTSRQESLPPSYNDALNMVIVPCQNQN